MNDKLTLLASALLVLFFLIGGLTNILDLMISKVILLGGFIAIILVILLAKPKEKNLD